MELLGFSAGVLNNKSWHQRLARTGNRAEVIEIPTRRERGTSIMKAAVFYGPNDLRIEERPAPAIAPAEILLKVATCSICGSDVRTFRFGAGNITEPVTMGHDVAGGN